MESQPGRGPQPQPESSPESPKAGGIEGLLNAAKRRLDYVIGGSGSGRGGQGFGERAWKVVTNNDEVTRQFAEEDRRQQLADEEQRFRHEFPRELFAQYISEEQIDNAVLHRVNGGIEPQQFNTRARLASFRDLVNHLPPQQALRILQDDAMLRFAFPDEQWADSNVWENATAEQQATIAGQLYSAYDYENYQARRELFFYERLNPALMRNLFVNRQLSTARVFEEQLHFKRTDLDALKTLLPHADSIKVSLRALMPEISQAALQQAERERYGGVEIQNAHVKRVIQQVGLEVALSNPDFAQAYSRAMQEAGSSTAIFANNNPFVKPENLYPPLDKYAEQYAKARRLASDSLE